jgi:hypothetical protein
MKLQSIASLLILGTATLVTSSLSLLNYTSPASAQCVGAITNVDLVMRGSKTPTQFNNKTTTSTDGSCIGNGTSQTGSIVVVDANNPTTINRSNEIKFGGGTPNPTGVGAPTVFNNATVQVDVYNPALNLLAK